MEQNLLEIKNLRVHYVTDTEDVQAVNGVDLHLKKGEVLGLVGETGAGKTTVALSVMQLVPDPPGIILDGEILFKGRNLIRNLLLITMVIPVMATIIPLFRLFVARELLDNVFWLSLVYVSSYLPLITWLMSDYFATIPKELEEAAWIDGCGRMNTFFRIIVPASYPIILSAALIMFLNTWNQFQIPLILASSLETKPIAIVVSEFMTKDSVQYGLTAAAGIIAVIPPAVTALIFRRFLISGMMGGAVKG